jgi:hypothetical protein
MRFAPLGSYVGTLESEVDWVSTFSTDVVERRVVLVFEAHPDRVIGRRRDHEVVGLGAPDARERGQPDPETEVGGADFPCEGLVSSRFGVGRRVASRRSAVANVAWSW